MEAQKRKLTNHKTTPEALKARISEKSIRVFEQMKVMNEVEVKARYEIELEEYVKKIQIEGRVLGDIARNHVIPTAIRYQNLVVKNLNNLKSVFGKEFETLGKEQIQIVKEISHHIEIINSKVIEMTEERKKSNAIADIEQQAKAYCEKVKPFFDPIRYHCDKLELVVDNETWTLTKYRELLFTK